LAGRPPRSKGRRYPADPPRTEEIIAVMRSCGDGVYGLRARGLIIVLWRAGLRIQEALDLTELLATGGRPPCFKAPTRCALAARHGRSGASPGRERPAARRRGSAATVVNGIRGTVARADCPVVMAPARRSRDCLTATVADRCAAEGVSRALSARAGGSPQLEGGGAGALARQTCASGALTAARNRGHGQIMGAR
jgi:hypothetical protein